MSQIATVATGLGADQFIQAQPLPNHARPRLETTQWNWTNTPSWTNIFWTPIDAVATGASWVRARAAGDEEGQFDAGLRLAGMPLSILHAVGALATFLLEIGYILEAKFLTELKPILDLTRLPIMSLGIGLCVIEGIYEAICLRRTVQLLQNMQTSELYVLNDAIAQFPERNAELLGRKRELLVTNLTYFRDTYFTISDEENERIRAVAQRHFPEDGDSQQREITQKTRALAQVKHANLDRRVRPWCGLEIGRQLNPLLERLQAGDHAAVAEAEELLATVDTQARKKLLIHIVGLAAIILCAIGFILTMVACPAVIPFALITAAGILSTLNYVYAKGALDEQGWGFSITKAIPPIGWIYDRIHSCCVEDVELSHVSELP